MSTVVVVPNPVPSGSTYLVTVDGLHKQQDYALFVFYNQQNGTRTDLIADDSGVITASPLTPSGFIGEGEVVVCSVHNRQLGNVEAQDTFQVI